MQCAGSRIPARCGRCGFLRPLRRIQAEPMIGAMLARFDEVAQKANEICPLHQERRGRSTNGKIFFLLLFLIFAVSLFAVSAHGKQLNAATVKVAGTVFVQDSAGNRSVVAGVRVKLDGPAAFETETD